jgi:hypothetical protein
MLPISFRSLDTRNVTFLTRYFQGEGAWPGCTHRQWFCCEFICWPFCVSRLTRGTLEDWHM